MHCNGILKIDMYMEQGYFTCKDRYNVHTTTDMSQLVDLLNKALVAVWTNCPLESKFMAFFITQFQSYIIIIICSQVLHQS